MKKATLTLFALLLAEAASAAVPYQSPGYRNSVVVEHSITITGTVATSTPASGIGATLFSVEADVIVPVAPVPSATWMVHPSGVSATLVSVEADVIVPVAPVASATWMVHPSGVSATLISVEADVLVPVAPAASATWMIHPSGVSATLISVEPDVLLTVAPSAGATFFVVNTAASPLTVTPDDSSTWWTMPKASDLTQTLTGAADAGFTLTLPAPAAGLYHYITSIEIIKYVTAAVVASASPITVTTTNLGGALSRNFTFRRVGAIADAETALFNFASPVRSTTSATATTIVGPAVTGVLWAVTVHYYTAP